MSAISHLSVVGEKNRVSMGNLILEVKGERYDEHGSVVVTRVYDAIGRDTFGLPHPCRITIQGLLYDKDGTDESMRGHFEPYYITVEEIQEG